LFPFINFLEIELRNYKATYGYFNEHLNSHKQNPKYLWNSVRELSGLNNTTQYPSLNDENGNLYLGLGKAAHTSNCVMLFVTCDSILLI